MPRPNSMSTVQVQKWVLTVLVVVVLGHLAEALVIFALMASEDHPASRIGLLVIAGLVGPSPLAASEPSISDAY